MKLFRGSRVENGVAESLSYDFLNENRYKKLRVVPLRRSAYKTIV